MNYTERFKAIRQHTVDLCKPLSIEDHLAQPIVDVSPPKWHLGHTTWFFETFILKPHFKGYTVFDPTFNFIFNSYYETVGQRVIRDQRGNLTRPPVQRIYEYRTYVDAQMLKYLATEPQQEILDLLELGLNHEQQHQELFLTDFKFILASQPFHPVYSNTFVEDQKQDKPSWITIPEGVYEIGHQGNGFCFDNELGVHKTYLHEYAINSQLVTNKQWLEFIEDGGYENFNYWHSEGWGWVKNNNIEAPQYWESTAEGWKRFTLSGLQNIDPEAAVTHISYYEAYAFAEWSGLRIPTEQEWEVASKQFNWGHRWEWTNSAYLPYPNFAKAEGAVGEYNGKFMVNQMVLRGASVATSPEHSRNTYRNFFHPFLRWQFTGLRLAK